MNKWFSVDEKLPPLCEYVIVAICDESGDTPWKYTTSGWMPSKDIWIVDNDINYSVTHWMPFPSYPLGKEVHKTILHKHIAEVLNEALKDYGCKIFVEKPRIVDICADKTVAKIEVYLEFDWDEIEV